MPEEHPVISTALEGSAIAAAAYRRRAGARGRQRAGAAHAQTGGR